MTRPYAIFLVFGLVVLGSAGAYWVWHDSGQQIPPAGHGETEETNSDADFADKPMQASGEPGQFGRTPKPAALAEFVRPNIVTYKRGKPIWELPYAELHEHVDDLRALADAGWGQAVFPLVRLVSSCLGNREPRTEREVRDQARSMRQSRLANRSDWPEDEVQRQVAQVDDWLEYHLQYSARRRSACAAVTPADEGRIMDWFELALEQRHPAFLAGYLRWELLPPDDAWVVRHAERLASFNRRFEAAYLDGVYAAELSMLDLAWRLYATRKVLPEPESFKAYAFNHAADLEARESPGMTRQYMDSYRLEAIGLDPARVDEARAEGERIHDRCCADRRTPGPSR